MSVEPLGAPEIRTLPRVAGVRFEQLAARDDSDIDVALGATLIAKDAYPELDVDAVVRRFDELAAPLAELGIAALPPDEQAKALADHLYVTHGFKGNEADYYDPKNSLLPDVLERRLGIPITLAIVYTEVARRCGVRARGVSFPGHFLVRIDPQALAAASEQKETAIAARSPIFVDPFFGGRVLGEASLLKLLRRGTTPHAELRDEHTKPAEPRAVLVRMLINLKWIYMTRGDYARAHLALDRIVSLTPEAPAALRERGLLAARLGATEAATADLTKLLEIQPDTADANAIRARLVELRATKRALN